MSAGYALGTELDLSPDSLDKEFSYQWFAASIDGDSLEGEVRARAAAGGWRPVPREEMPGEPSEGEEFIERGSLRLYGRPLLLAEDAVKRDIGKALEAFAVVERRSSRGRWQDRPLIEGYACDGTTILQGRKGFWPRSHGMVYPPRGAVFMIHEESLRRWAVAVASRYWRILLRFRVCYLSKDEGDIAEMQTTPFGEWAWHKKDLLRKNVIPSTVPAGSSLRLKVIRVPLPKLPKLPAIPWRKLWGSLFKRSP